MRLRRSIGVREDILDWIPEERGRYTRLGTIVVNTAAMAALSFLVAMHSISTSAAWLLFVPFALLWGYVVFTLDAWLISSTHGRLGTSKLLVFVPRFIVSVLFGFVIAEPLVMTVFGAEIEQMVDKTRQDEISAYSGRLAQCNPTTGAVVSDASCADFQVTVANPPYAKRTELQTLVDERDSAVETMKPLSTELEVLQTRAVNECAGTPGVGLSGVAGNGPECRYNREAVEKFRQENGIELRQRDIAELNDKIAAKTGEVATADATYAGQIARAITDRVDERQAGLGATGLLEQIKALHTLSEDNLAVLVAQWLVRLLLLAIDCLPVFAKVLNGTTAYDERVHHQVAAGKDLHERHITLRARQDSVDFEVSMHEVESDLQDRLDQIDEAARNRRAQREIAKRNQIASLAEDLRGRGLAG